MDVNDSASEHVEENVEHITGPGGKIIFVI